MQKKIWIFDPVHVDVEQLRLASVIVLVDIRICRTVDLIPRESLCLGETFDEVSFSCAQLTFKQYKIMLLANLSAVLDHLLWCCNNHSFLYKVNIVR